VTLLLNRACQQAVFPAGQPGAPGEYALLSKIKQTMKRNLQRVPNYTCLETIERSQRLPRSLVVSRDGGPGPFRPQDIVRLEVAEVEGKEFFSRPGARDFHETSLEAFVNGGMIGNGIFALFTKDIFATDAPTYHFGGKGNMEGRELVRYDYWAPYLGSGYTVKSEFGAAEVAFYGSFWADPQTLQAVRLDVRADDIPAYIGLTDTRTRINYAIVRIGTSDALLPQSAEMTVHQLSDYESRNRIEFTHCSQYTAESVISFDTETAASSSRANRIEIPAGLTLAIGLERDIDLESARVGDLVTGVVLADVKRRGRVIVPKGASVSGRIRRLERYVDESPYYVVGLEFLDVDFPGNRVRFFAEMERITAAAEGVAKAPSAHLPGVGTFTVRGSGLRLPVEMRMLWKTVHYSEDDN
jgi:hypothetical protein